MRNRILIIDDDVAVRESIKHGLTVFEDSSKATILAQKKAKLFGRNIDDKDENVTFLPGEKYDLVLSSSGEEGIELLKESIAANDPFQVVFIDIRMPGMSGDECSRQIRKIDNNIGVCFITGYSDKNITTLVKTTGGDVDKILFLKKPFDYDEIKQIARAFSAKWHAERKSAAFHKSLTKLINGITKLKDIPLHDLRKLLETVLYQILHFIGVENGFIATIGSSNSLHFEVGTGKFNSPSDIKDIQLPDDFAKIQDEDKKTTILQNKDKIMIPMIAVQCKRIVVAIDKSELNKNNKHFIKILAENASTALSNAGLFSELINAKEALEQRIQERARKINETNKKLTQISIIDPLTGVYNRRYFEEALNNEVACAKKSGSEIILMMIDIDFFKSINESHGDYEADKIIAGLASILSEDRLPGDIVSRYGGDEFLIIFPGIHLKNAYSIAKRISSRFDKLSLIAGIPDIKLNLSIGIATLNSDIYYIKEGADLFKKVEEALYIAKKNGRNRVEAWKPMDELQYGQPDILWDQINGLRNKVKDIFYKIKENHSQELCSIISAIENENICLAKHSKNVSCYTLEFLSHLNIDKQYVEEIYTASILHDLGKTGVPDHIINKKDPLNHDEWKIIKNHPVLSVKIMQQTMFSGKEIYIIKHHHERFDGKGYPDGLKNKYIPFGSRIINITNSFDAMTTISPYHAKMNIEQVINEMKKCSGTQFDPELVEKFIDLLKKKNDIWPLD